MPDSISLNPIFRDLLKAFLDENVEFIVIGGYAVIAHGHLRATGDIDLWIRPSTENAPRVWAALRRFGAPLSKVVEADFADPELFYFVGSPPFRVDILGDVDGAEFEAAWNRRQMRMFGDMAVPVLSLEDLIATKRAAGRPKDLVDLRRAIGPKWGGRKHASPRKPSPTKKRKKKKE